MSLQQKEDSKAVEVIDPQRDALAELPPQDSQASADCPRCFGTGMEVVPGVGARRCECQSSGSRSRLLDSTHIPPRYQHCTIQGYFAGDNELSKWAAKVEAQIVIDNYLTL